MSEFPLLSPIKSIVSSLAKLAINKFLKFEIWKGSFFVVVEKEPSFANVIDDSDLDRLSKNLYKEKPHSIIDDLKNQLSDMGLNNDESDKFVDLWKKEIRDHNPDIYVLICVDDLDKEYDLIKDDIAQIQSSLIELQTTIKKQINCKNIDDIDDWLKKQSATTFKIGLDYYDFADEDFLETLNNRLLSNEKLIKISGAYTKETLYATLCALKSIYKDHYLDKVRIIDNSSSLEMMDVSAFEGVSVLVTIVDDYDDDTPIIEGYTNIHIASPLSGNETIKLRRRTRDSSIEALKKAAKMDACEASAIIDGVDNCFPFFYRKMYSVDSNKKGKIVRAIDKKNIALSLLYNGWNKSFQGDREILEKNSGMEYQTFLEKVSPIDLIEDPFVKEKKGFFKQGIFVISIDEQWGLFSDFVSDELIDNFFSDAFDITTNYLINPSKYYSKNFVHTLFETTAFLNKYKKSVETKTIGFFEKLLKWTASHRRHNDISSFLSIMTESAPDFVLKKLESNIKEKGAFYRLFISGDSYLNVLWAFESMLFFGSSNYRAAKAIFELCKINRKFPTSNGPADSMCRILTAWVNTTPLSTNQKKEIAQWMIKNNREIAWPIIESQQFIGHGTVMLFNEPTIRQYAGFLKQSSTEDIKGLFKEYYDLCFENAKTREEWCKLIEDHSFVYLHEEKAFFDKLISQTESFNDVDKYAIKCCLDGLVYKHKFHSGANWSLPLDELALFEEASGKISFSKEEYDFVNLFEKRVLFPNPTAFSKDYSEYTKENDRKRESFIASRFKQFKEEHLSLSVLYRCIEETIETNQINGDSLFNLARSVKENRVNNGEILIELLEAFKGRKDFKIAGYYPLIFNADKSSGFSAFLDWIYENERHDVFNDCLSSITIDVENESFLEFYKSLRQSFVEGFWKDVDHFPRINEKSIKSILFCLERLYEQSNGVYIDLLFWFKDGESLSSDKLFELFFRDKVIQMMETSTLQYEASELLDEIEKKYKHSEDDSVLEKIIKFELAIGPNYGDAQYPTFYRVLARSPDLYVEYLERMYFGGERVNNRLFDRLHYLFFSPKFAPGLVSGSFDESVFKEWVDRFKELLSKHGGWADFFYDSLGKMFVNYPKGSDSLPMPISVRRFIETIDSEERLKQLKVAYYCGLTNFNIRTITDGSSLSKEAREHRTYAEKLKAAGYLQTATIFDYLSANLSKEADEERDAAVDE